MNDWCHLLGPRVYSFAREGKGRNCLCPLDQSGTPMTTDRPHTFEESEAYFSRRASHDVNARTNMGLNDLHIDITQLSFIQGLGLVVGGYFLYCILYGLFLCPTRHLPGPFLTRFTEIPFAINLTSGEVSKRIHRQHEIYGTPHFA
jgi:hypothetical protein